MDITKTYFMLPVRDMARALAFYQGTFSLLVDFESPYWSELHGHGATIALHHGGGPEEDRQSWLGFNVVDLDAALAEVEAAGGRRGKERTEGGARLLDVVDTEGNILTLGQSTSS
jgi:predicted enzyme related to lactoylglutathione lyase